MNRYYLVLDAITELFLKKIGTDSKFNRDEIYNIKDISISVDDIREETELLKSADDKTLHVLMREAVKELFIKGFSHEPKDDFPYSVWLVERSEINDWGDLILTPTQELLEVYKDSVFNAKNNLYIGLFGVDEEQGKEYAEICRAEIIDAIDDFYWR